MNKLKWKNGLPAAVLLLAGMTACSDEDMPGGNETPVSKSTITVGNNPAAQADRITFYGPNAGTRTDDNIYPNFSTVGSEPAVPDDVKGNVKTSYGEYNEDYCIDASWTGEKVYIGKEHTVYITGPVNGANSFTGGGTVVITKDGSLNLDDKSLEIEGTVVKAYNDVTVGGDLNLKAKGALLSHKNIIVKGQLLLSDDINELIAEKLEVEGKVQLGKQSMVKARSILFKYDDNEDKDVNLTGAYLAVQNYMYCESLYMDGDSRVFLWPNAMAVINDRLSMVASENGGFFYHTNLDKTDNALVKTNELYVDGDLKNVESLFSGVLKLAYKGIYTTSGKYEGDFIASADDYYISPDYSDGNCNPGNGKKESFAFDPIAKVEPPTHNHTHLSASCVQAAADGKHAYVSYHLNEEYKDNADNYVPTSKYMGCVEYYTINPGNTTTGENGNAEVTSWLMNQDFDFNHLIVNDNKLYVVGDKKNGANLGVVSLNGGAFTEATEMQTYRLYNDKNAGNGGSGNCILYDKSSNFLIASYNGFQMLDASTLAEKKDAFSATAGSAKHIAMNEKYIVTLNLDKKGTDVTESSATVNVYNVSGFSGFKEKGDVSSFTIPVITPIDGKNVIAVRGEHVYVALGEAGVAKYNVNGTLDASYSWIAEKLETNPEYTGHPRANGLYVDAEYVYVANGDAGLIVLNSGNLKRVARYTRKKNGVPYSANYVEKVGDLLYIAYGRSGLDVVKMIVPSKDNTTNE